MNKEVKEAIEVIAKDLDLLGRFPRILPNGRISVKRIRVSGADLFANAAKYSKVIDAIKKKEFEGVEDASLIEKTISKRHYLVQDFFEVDHREELKIIFKNCKKQFLTPESTADKMLEYKAYVEKFFGIEQEVDSSDKK